MKTTVRWELSRMGYTDSQIDYMWYFAAKKGSILARVYKGIDSIPPMDSYERVNCKGVATAIEKDFKKRGGDVYGTGIKKFLALYKGTGDLRDKSQGKHGGIGLEHIGFEHDEVSCMIWMINSKRISDCENKITAKRSSGLIVLEYYIYFTVIDGSVIDKWKETMRLTEEEA